jgi:ADP-dependent NAD(P)H-hydrate dehydratase
MSRPRTTVTPIDAALLRRWPLPGLPANADKKARGDVLVVGGSREMPGAVLLAGEAALRVGAGRVQLATAREAAIALAVAVPEARVLGLPTDRRGELSATGAAGLREHLGCCRALLVGPGMLEHALASRICSAIRRTKPGLALVLDAAALRVLRGRKPVSFGAPGGVIATPHAGEMADLWGCSREEVERAPLELARRAAHGLNVTLVLKGVVTWVVTPVGQAYRNVAGNSGLATAGSGDALGGLIAGLAARGADPAQAAVWGVALHAQAGDALARKQGPLGYVARELSTEVPALLGKRALSEPARKLSLTTSAARRAPLRARADGQTRART